uniref:Pyridoxamine 5'-phosphate oxidase N-terminal domain-containing protein n=1 Tax=Desulfobacca acetoxidans TaxID=60893 RepID=A0A7V4GAA2_9BACT
MARVVGDSLIVNLARKPGEEQILNLMELFNQNPNRIIAVAGTVGPDGAPNTAPVSLMYAKDPKTLLMALLRTTTTSANLRRDGRVSLEIFQEGDVVLGIQGAMRLIREPMEFSEAMALWEMRVERVKLDTSPAQRIIQGPASVPRNDKAAAFEAAGVAELMAAAAGGGGGQGP